MKVSPIPNNVRVTKIAANYVEVAWNDTSLGTYLYIVEYKRPTETTWTTFGSFTGGSVYVSGLNSETEYVFRVKTRIPIAVFQDSAFVETDPVTTFAENAFTVSTPENVELTNNFVNRKLKQNASVIDFNSDQINVALMKEDVVFNPAINNIVDYDQDIVFTDRTQYVYGKIPFVVTEKDRVILGSWENILYVFHAETREAFFSQNKGESWTRYFPLSSLTIGKANDNYAFKASDSRAALTTNQSIILGSTISSGLRWSSTDEKFSNVEDRFNRELNEFNVEGGGGDILRFNTEIPFPSGINEIQCMDIADDWLFIVAGGGAVYQVDFNNPVLDGSNNIIFDTNFDQIVDGVDNLNAKSCWKFGDNLYILVAGEIDPSSGDVVSSQYSGVWKFDYSLRTFEKVLGDENSVDPVASSLGTDGSRLIASLTVNDDTDPDAIVSANTPKRKVYRSTDGSTWSYRPERFALESRYGYFRNDGTRIWMESTSRVTAIEEERQFIKNNGTTSENFTQFGVFNFYYRDRISFNGFPGFAAGLMFYERDSGNVIGFYRFTYRTRTSVEINLTDDLLLSAALDSISRTVQIDTGFNIPVRTIPKTTTISHLTEKIAPEHYIDDPNSLYGDFIRFYLESLSESKMPIDAIRDLVTNRNPNTTEFMELFETDLAKRNVIDTGQRRLDVLTFLKNREYDFISSRGIEASYKFMFRVLYDVDVEVIVEGRKDYETFFTIESDDVDLDQTLPGVYIQGDNGDAQVAYAERTFKDGVGLWTIVIQKVYGRFNQGDSVADADGTLFTGTVVDSLANRDVPRNLDVSRLKTDSFYTIRVSGVSMARWKNDVLRFVHPVGFNFTGILLLTMLANTGLTLQHIETLENVLIAYRWDSGIPTVVWDETADLDVNGDYQYPAGGGFPLTNPNPDAGNTINPDAQYYNDNPEVVYGLTTEQRRSANSPLFDATVYRFVNFRRV